MRSIRRQLTRHLVATTCVLVGGGLLAVYLAARESLFDRFDDALRAKALAIGSVTRAEANGVNVAFDDRFLRGFDDDKARDFFHLWDDQGRTLARSDSLGRRDELAWRRGRPDRPARWNVTLPNGEPGRAVAFAFMPRGDDGPGRGKAGVRLTVASEREELDEELWQLLGLSAATAVLLIGATAVSIPFVLRRGLRPLDRLAAQTARIDAGSLATRLTTTELPDELQPIADRLNELLARLERSFERERRFSADLAHELRTPLAELRSTAECALKWPDARDPGTDRESLAIIENMETLVTQMLALARGEQGQIAASLEPVRVDELVADVWRRFAPQAAARQLAVSVSFAPVTGSADPALLRLIVANLLTNAVEYTPVAGTIDLVVETDGTRAVLRVTNTVAGFDPADVDRLFDRFWRKEAARGGTHLGLGLALAQSFATAMNWHLAARLDSSTHLSFTLAGPV